MKSIFASRTLWINAIALAVGLIGVCAASDLVAAYPAIVAGFVSAQSALNIVLRFLTTKPIG